MSRNRQTLSGQRSRVLHIRRRWCRRARACRLRDDRRETGNSTTDPPTTATPATSPPTTNPPTGGGSGNQVTAAESNCKLLYRSEDVL